MKKKCLICYGRGWFTNPFDQTFKCSCQTKKRKRLSVKKARMKWLKSILPEYRNIAKNWDEINIEIGWNDCRTRLLKNVRKSLK